MAEDFEGCEGLDRIVVHHRVQSVNAAYEIAGEKGSIGTLSECVGVDG
jgi:hypothetical protein